MARRRRQAGKGKKRLKSYHRGRGEEEKWQATMKTFPDLGVEVDFTQTTPQKLRKGPGGQNRGDALS